MNKRFVFAGLFVLALFAGCGNNKTPESETTRTDSLSQIHSRRSAPADVPDWYVASLQDTGKLTGLGFAGSRHLPIARNKAMLEAQADLARKLDQHPDSVFSVSLGKTKVLNQTRLQKGKIWQVYVRLALESDSLKANGNN